MVAKGRRSFPFGFRRLISSGELLVSGRVTFEEIAFRSIDFLETLVLKFTVCLKIEILFLDPTSLFFCLFKIKGITRG